MFFHLLVSTLLLLASSKLHVHHPLWSNQLYPPVLKYTSNKDLELMRLLTVELCSIKKNVCCRIFRSVLHKINVGPISLHEALHDGIVALM